MTIKSMFVQTTLNQPKPKDSKIEPCTQIVDDKQTQCHNVKRLTSCRIVPTFQNKHTHETKSFCTSVKHNLWNVNSSRCQANQQWTTHACDYQALRMWSQMCTQLEMTPQSQSKTIYATSPCTVRSQSHSTFEHWGTSKYNDKSNSDQANTRYDQIKWSNQARLPCPFNMQTTSQHQHQVSGKIRAKRASAEQVEFKLKRLSQSRKPNQANPRSKLSRNINYDT